MLLEAWGAPVYPCLIHFTPEHFGDEKSQAVIGVQMASAYVGSTFMPPLFGILANHISIALLPVYIGLLLTMMFLLSERLNRMTEQIAEWQSSRMKIKKR